MVGSLHHAFPVPDRSYLGLVRRDVTRLAESWRLDEATVGRLNIVVAELTSNLVKHVPQGGQLLVAPLPDATGAPVGVEVIALDAGPGMREPARMMQDGVSTYGSAGEGLGAIRRQADAFDLYTQPGQGTALLARLYQRRLVPPVAPGTPRCGAIMVPKPGEQACGDGWALRLPPTGPLLLVTDGLGHGPDAARATQAAIDTFRASPERSPCGLLRALHPSLKGTRGAVAAVAALDLKRAKVRYCGVGNITGRLLGGTGAKSLISYNGIVGHSLPHSMHDNEHPTDRTQALLLASDGLKSRWEFAKYPGLLARDPSLVAAVLYRDQVRGTDDTLVLVVVFS